MGVPDGWSPPPERAGQNPAYRPTHSRYRASGTGTFQPTGPRVGHDGPMASDEYYYCLKHNAVEGADGCRAKDRLGPYATPGEASDALERVEERNVEWDNDPDWNDDLADGEAKP